MKLHRSGAIQALSIFLLVRLIGLCESWIFARARNVDFFKIFTRWDAQWYRSIAGNGYGFQRIKDGHIHSNEAFFPLFPLLERALHAILPLSYISAGLIISWIAGLWAAAMIYLLVEKLANKRIALATVLLWSLYPISYVALLAYSETLFTALAATALYCLYRRWLAAATLVAIFAGLTRPTGLAVAVAVVLPILYQLILYRTGHKRISTYFALIFSAAGWLAYILYLARKNHDLFSYFQVQKNWGNGFDGGRHFISWIFDLLLSSKWYLGLLLLAAVGLIIALLILLYRENAFSPVLIYTTLLLILAFTTEGYFGSKPRYLMPAFPLFFPIAQWLTNKSRRYQILTYVLIAAIGLTYGAIAMTGDGPP